MPGNQNSGNSTARRGKPPKQRLRISRQSALQLRALVAANVQPCTEDEYVELLIEAAWRELDAEYQAAAEQAEIYGD